MKLEYYGTTFVITQYISNNFISTFTVLRSCTIVKLRLFGYLYTSIWYGLPHPCIYVPDKKNFNVFNSSPSISLAMPFRKTRNGKSSVGIILGSSISVIFVS